MTALLDEHPRLGVEPVLRELHIASSTYYRWRRAEREPCEHRRRDAELTALLERVRAEQSTDEWKDRYAARAGVEGTIHQAVAAAGARRTRYIGRAKTRLAHILTATAINLIRLDAWWNETPLARTRTSRLAALDLAA